MPRDLFGDVVCRAPRARSPRTLTIYSIALHALVISGVLAAETLAPDSLPVPNRPLTFQDVQVIKVVDPPPLPPPPRGATTATAPAASENLAPVVAPTAILKETGREGEPVMRSALRDSVGVGPGPGSPFGIIEGVPLPPVQEPPPQAPIRLHSGMLAPVKTVNVSPLYPSLAQMTRVQGVVILEAVIDVRGVVTSVRVLRSIPLLDQAAADAVRQWRFTPAKLNDQVVPVVMTVTVNFELSR